MINNHGIQNKILLKTSSLFFNPIWACSASKKASHRHISIYQLVPTAFATPRSHPSSVVPPPSSAVPRSSSRPSSTAPSLNLQSQPSLAVSAPTNTNSDSLRGKKREREDGINGVPPPADSTYTNGVLNGNRSQKMNAKVGFAGVRPRPIKKQRMVGLDSATPVHKPWKIMPLTSFQDGQGQARDVSAPVQQPTPQGA